MLLVRVYGIKHNRNEDKNNDVSHRAPKLLYLWLPCFVACTIYPPSHILFEEFTCILEMVLLNLNPHRDIAPRYLK